MNEEQRRKLENEAKSWLQIQINEIALKKACAIKGDETYSYEFNIIKIKYQILFWFCFSEDQLCAEMKDYLEHTYNIISTSLDRHLYSKQKKINSEISSNLKDSNTNDENDIINLITTYSEKNDLRGVYKNKDIIDSSEFISIYKPF